MGRKKKQASMNNKKQKNTKKRKVKISESFIRKIMPFGNIRFKSDYFQTGVYYGTVLTFITDAGSVSGLPPMWGSQLIPVTENSEVTARLVVSLQTRDKAWVESHASAATDVAEGAIEDAARAKQGLELSRSASRSYDNSITTQELAQGASYLDVTYRIVLYAQTKSDLDEAIRQLSHHYQSYFGTARLTKYIGQQQEDFTRLLGPATEQLGLHDGYTSIEFAGFYPFVGKGWTDQNGIYIGQTAGDINVSPVIWDSSTVSNIAIVGARGKANVMTGELNSSAQATWLQLMSKENLVRGHQSFELVLNDEHVEDIGMETSASTVTVDANKGEINPFQAFGAREEQLQLFNILVTKIKVMLNQLNPSMSDDEKAIINKELEAFYESKGLWSADAQNNLEDLRLVGLADNTQVPRLKDLVVHFSQRYKQYAEGTATTSANSLMAQIYLRIANMLVSMQSQYGYLFDTFTSIDMDYVNSQPRKIVKFGNLQQSGKEVLMAQFINYLAFLVPKMNDGDTLYIYGAEYMTDMAWDYLNSRLNYMQAHGMKVVFGFNDPGAGINSPVFEDADTVITGKMTASNIQDYASHMLNDLPNSLVSQISEPDTNDIYYLRRGNQNVVFHFDAQL